MFSLTTDRVLSQATLRDGAHITAERNPSDSTNDWVPWTHTLAARHLRTERNVIKVDMSFAIPGTRERVDEYSRANDVVSIAPREYSVSTPVTVRRDWSLLHLKRRAYAALVKHMGYEGLASMPPLDQVYVRRKAFKGQSTVPDTLFIDQFDVDSSVMEPSSSDAKDSKEDAGSAAAAAAAAIPVEFSPSMTDLGVMNGMCLVMEPLVQAYGCVDGKLISKPFGPAAVEQLLHDPSLVSNSGKMPYFLELHTAVANKPAETGLSGESRRGGAAGAAGASHGGLRVQRDFDGEGYIPLIIASNVTVRQAKQIILEVFLQRALASSTSSATDDDIDYERQLLLNPPSEFTLFRTSPDLSNPTKPMLNEDIPLAQMKLGAGEGLWLQLGRPAPKGGIKLEVFGYVPIAAIARLENVPIKAYYSKKLEQLRASSAGADTSASVSAAAAEADAPSSGDVKEQEDTTASPSSSSSSSVVVASDADIGFTITSLNADATYSNGTLQSLFILDVPVTATLKALKHILFTIFSERAITPTSIATELVRLRPPPSDRAMSLLEKTPSPNHLRVRFITRADGLGNVLVGDSLPLTKHGLRSEAKRVAVQLLPDHRPEVTLSASEVHFNLCAAVPVALAPTPSSSPSPPPSTATASDASSSPAATTTPADAASSSTAKSTYAAAAEAKARTSEGEAVSGWAVIGPGIPPFLHWDPTIGTGIAKPLDASAATVEREPRSFVELAGFKRTVAPAAAEGNDKAAGGKGAAKAAQVQAATFTPTTEFTAFDVAAPSPAEDYDVSARALLARAVSADVGIPIERLAVMLWNKKDKQWIPYHPLDVGAEPLVKQLQSQLVPPAKPSAAAKSEGKEAKEGKDAGKGAPKADAKDAAAATASSSSSAAATAGDSAEGANNSNTSKGKGKDANHNNNNNKKQGGEGKEKEKDTPKPPTLRDDDFICAVDVAHFPNAREQAVVAIAVANADRKEALTVADGLGYDTASAKDTQLKVPAGMLGCIGAILPLPPGISLSRAAELKDLEGKFGSGSAAADAGKSSSKKRAAEAVLRITLD